MASAKRFASSKPAAALVTLARSVLAAGPVSQLHPQRGTDIMAETNTPNGGAAPGGAPAEGMEPQMPSIQIVSQYIKDLSFENPSLGVNVQRPQIEFTVDLQARRMQENGPFEVVLKMRVSAQQEEKTIFLLEIAYGGIFVLDKVPEEMLQPILLIECPRLMFPFVRRIVSDLVSDGGLPPLMIEPIDFTALYRSKMIEAQGRQQEAPRQV
jgi:preprotein translocase subunit SecB